jgi:hypothetical protein
MFDVGWLRGEGDGDPYILLFFNLIVHLEASFQDQFQISNSALQKI